MERIFKKREEQKMITFGAKIEKHEKMNIVN